MVSEPTAYTHAVWTVRPGEEDAFVTAWHRVADVFLELDNPPVWGKLIRSTADPTVFCSFGPWEDAADIDAMRAHPGVREALAAAIALCVTATPGGYELVASRGAGEP